VTGGPASVGPLGRVQPVKRGPRAGSEA